MRLKNLFFRKSSFANNFSTQSVESNKMAEWFILKDPEGKIIYRGTDRLQCRRERNIQESTTFTEYRYNIMGDDFLNIKKIDWAHDDLCKPGEFRQVSPTQSIQITGKYALSDLDNLIIAQMINQVKKQ